MCVFYVRNDWCENNLRTDFCKVSQFPPSLPLPFLLTAGMKNRRRYLPQQVFFRFNIGINGSVPPSLPPTTQSLPPFTPFNYRSPFLPPLLPLSIHPFNPYCYLASSASTTRFQVIYAALNLDIIGGFYSCLQQYRLAYTFLYILGIHVTSSTTPLFISPAGRWRFRLTLSAILILGRSAR